LFEYRDPGTVALKGFAEDVPACQVLGASAADGRFEALHATTAPLVGVTAGVALDFRCVNEGTSCAVFRLVLRCRRDKLASVVTTGSGCFVGASQEPLVRDRLVPNDFFLT
jgi:hypothetical protein